MKTNPQCFRCTAQLRNPRLARIPLGNLNLLACNLLAVLLERVRRVGAQVVLGIVAGLLGALLGAGALLVDVVGGLAGLSTGLALGVGRLAAGVGSGHFERWVGWLI